MLLRFIFLISGLLAISSLANDLPKVSQFGSKFPVVTIVVFGDFECPYCARASFKLESLLKSNSEKVNLVYRNFPLPFHKHSRSAALAAVCANAQGAFQGMHDLMYQYQDQLGVDGVFLKFANQLKIDTTAFSTCLASKDAAEILEWGRGSPQKL